MTWWGVVLAVVGAYLALVVVGRSVMWIADLKRTTTARPGGAKQADADWRRVVGGSDGG